MNAKFAQIRAEILKLNQHIGLRAALTPFAMALGVLTQPWAMMERSIRALCVRDVDAKDSFMATTGRKPLSTTLSLTTTEDDKGVFIVPTSAIRQTSLQIAAGLLTALALATVPSTASAGHSWGDFHWARTSNPFTLKLVRKLSSTWSPYLDLASSAWSISPKLNTKIVLGNSSAASRQACATVAGRTVVCNYPYGPLGWLGLATIWLDGNNHIVQATAKMNDSYSWGSGKRQLVMCQEVGHTFGLDHQDEGFSNANLGTCMDYTSLPFGPPNNLALNQHDLDQLDAIYANLDGYTTLTQTSPAAALPFGSESIDFNQPDQWGTLLESVNDGRTEVYERDLGDGYKVVNFVIWAQEK